MLILWREIGNAKSGSSKNSVLQELKAIMPSFQKQLCPAFIRNRKPGGWFCGAMSPARL
jgi:hypothetical protein